MSDTTQIILGVIFLVVVYALTRMGVSWKFSQVAQAILKDLERKGAVDLESAVELPYAKQPISRIGMRDYHSKALQYMVSEGVVSKTEEGRYYLSQTSAERFAPASNTE
jgi:hypothetical protein